MAKPTVDVDEEVKELSVVDGVASSVTWLLDCVPAVGMAEPDEDLVMAESVEASDVSTLPVSQKSTTA